VELQLREAFVRAIWKFPQALVLQRMLTLTLRKLERDAVVQRTVFPVIPPRVRRLAGQIGVDRS
jgi:DNA-binding HxlR family transcriptional regulator